MDLHLADPADARPISALSKSEIEQGLAQRWLPARVRKCIADPDTNVLVAKEGAVLIGFGIMTYGDEHAHLCLFAVHPEFRRRGVGAALLAWLERVAEMAGIRRLGMEARLDNHAALRFYRRQGYRNVSIVVGMYQGVEDGIRLEKRLGQDAAA